MPAVKIRQQEPTLHPALDEKLFEEKVFEA
jgi:hypothetical protein